MLNNCVAVTLLDKILYTTTLHPAMYFLHFSNLLYLLFIAQANFIPYGEQTGQIR